MNLSKLNIIKEREEYLRGLAAVGKLDSELCEALIEKGITTCPASLNHHGNYEGGLFDHCKEMYEALDEMTQRLELHWISEKSVGNIAWGHDMCKLDSYIKVVDEWNEDGSNKSWHYEYNNESGLVGHGVKSAILVQQATSHLTEEEIYCIVFHMGAYEKDQWKAYENAIKRFPNVLFTHTADMCAAKIVGV